ncbi:mu-protocadherin-putative cell-suface protein [Rhodopirellula sp. SWK7]|nr:mu-protocadherin-putative cell-suface protein [Rhodopirellula sp. SWK7]
MGPGGGSFQAGRGSGSFTTQGGATVDYGGRGGSRTGPAGVTRGRGVGGVKVTGPGGQEFSKVGRAGGVQGPGGNAIGGSRGISQTTGPAGSARSISRTGFASGPNSMSAFRGGVAVGPGGVVAGRTGVAANGHGTYFRSAAAVSGQGVAVRRAAVGYHGCFTNTWCAKYPAAWYPVRWGAAAAWTAATWNALSSYGGYPVSQPVSYDYGSTVVYQDDSVYIDGDVVGTSAEYAEQATEIAEAGMTPEATASVEATAAADPTAAPDDSAEPAWQPLGVFAMVQGEEKSSNNIFQLAINKDGVIHGNYYNAVTDTTEQVFGSVDKKTQRAAWMVGDAKTPVYEAGLVNLTKDETSMMIHYSAERSVQASLFRIKQDGDQAK